MEHADKRDTMAMYFNVDSFYHVFDLTVLLTTYEGKHSHKEFLVNSLVEEGGKMIQPSSSQQATSVAQNQGKYIRLSYFFHT